MNRRIDIGELIVLRKLQGGRMRRPGLVRVPEPDALGDKLGHEGVMPFPPLEIVNTVVPASPAPEVPARVLRIVT